MLTKEDKKEIKEMITDSLSDFFKNILVPYLDKEHEENKKAHELTRAEVKEQVDELKEYIKDHDKRITTLEQTRLN